LIQPGDNSLMLMPALNPHIGCEKAAQISLDAYREELRLRWVNRAAFSRLLPAVASAGLSIRQRLLQTTALLESAVCVGGAAIPGPSTNARQARQALAPFMHGLSAWSKLNE